MMAQHFFLSQVLEPLVGFLTNVPATIREGVAEVVDTISPSRKRRRSSVNSTYHPSPDNALHPHQKRSRLSDASASNAAGPSVPTPAAFRSAHDILAAATSPAHPNSQIVTRHPISTNSPLAPIPPPPSTTSPSNLDFQSVFRYPISQRRSSLNGLRDIWPRETDPRPTRRCSSTILNSTQNSAQLYWQRVQQRHRVRATTAYAQSAEKYPRSPRWRNSSTIQPYQPHSRTQSAITEEKHPIAALTKTSPTLHRTRLTPAHALLPRRAGIQKKRPYIEARLRGSYQRTVKRLASAAEVSLRSPHAAKSNEGLEEGSSQEARMNPARDTVPKPFVEILEARDSILSQKLLKKHGPAMKRLVQSQSRSRHQQLKCWLAELDLREIQRKRKEARRLNAIESEIRKPTDHHLQQPPEDDEFVNLDYWHDEDSYWNESTDNTALSERKKQITVSDEKAAFSPLSASAVKRLRTAMSDGSNQHETLSKIDGCIITGEDLRRLKPNCWLNDEIVNAYMALLSARTERFRTKSVKPSPFSSSKGPNVKIMSSFFYSKLVQFNRKLGKYEYNYSRVRRWTRRFDVFSFDVLLIPINEQNVHWTLGVVDLRNCKVEHLDSMGTGGSPSVREFLMQWVRDEAEDKQKSFDSSQWKATERRVPIQENTDDCGVFLCKYADFICRGWTKFTFSHRHMNYFRARIAHELLMGKA